MRSPECEAQHVSETTVIGNVALLGPCPSDYLPTSPFAVGTGSSTLLQDIYFESTVQAVQVSAWHKAALSSSQLVWNYDGRKTQNQTQLHYPNSDNLKKKTINSCSFLMVFSTTIKQRCLESGLNLFGQQKAPTTSWTATSLSATAEREELSAALKAAFSRLG